MYKISPEVSFFINEWVYAASLILAFSFPILRGIGRKCFGVRPAFKQENFRHDVGGGFIFPYFMLMTISPMLAETHIESHAYALAGIYGMFVIFTDLIDVGRGSHTRTRHDDE